MADHRPVVGVQLPMSSHQPSSVRRSSLGATGPGHGEPLEIVNENDEELRAGVRLTFVFSLVEHTLDFKVGLVPSCRPRTRVDHKSRRSSAYVGYGGKVLVRTAHPHRHTEPSDPRSLSNRIHTSHPR